MFKEFPKVTWQLRVEFQRESVVPHILDPWECLLDMLQTDRSIARLADGEFALATGTGTPNTKQQLGDLDLSIKLKQVLSCEKKNCRVAIPKWMIYWNPVQNSGWDGFVVKWFAPSCRKSGIFNYFKPDYLYYDSCMSVPQAHYGHFGREFVSSYYDTFKDFLRDKDVVLVTGDYERQSKLEFKLLDEAAKSVELVKTPYTNAFDDYDNIVKNVRAANKDGSKLVIACFGAAATCLAYDLCDEMRVLDLGHMLVDYNLSRNGKGTGNFWK